MAVPLSIDDNDMLLAGMIVISLLLHGLFILFLTDVYRPQRTSYIELTMQKIPRPLNPVSRDLPTPPVQKAIKQPPEMPSKKIRAQLKPVVRPLPNFKTMPPTVVSPAPPAQTAIPPLPEIVSAQEVRKTRPDETTPVVKQRLVPAASFETRPKPDDQSASKYLASIRARIEKHKRYPARAKIRHQEGKVTIRFVLTPSGDTQSLGVSKSSGREILDNAALKAVRDASPFPGMPGGIFKGEIPLALTIVFRLR